MNVSKRMLIAIDDSDATVRAVHYVSNLIGGRKGFVVCLLHVLEPLPQGLREFGGADPSQEQKLEEELKQKREQWIERGEREALPVLENAKSILKKAGFPAKAVETEFSISVNKQDLAGDILDAAQMAKCGTVIVGRESFSWLHEIFHTHVADELVRRGRGLNLWVVE